MQTETHHSSQAMPGSNAQQKLSIILLKLLAQSGIGQGKEINPGVESTGAPPINIQKHLGGLAEKVEPIVHVPQDSIQGQAPPLLALLALCTKPSLTTAEAAALLSRRPQTLRGWAMNDGIKGLRPIRINGRLAWKSDELCKLLGVQA